MVFTIGRKPKPDTQDKIDTQEAYNLWSGLTALYMALEQLSVFEHHAHDNDLNLVLQKMKNDYLKMVSELEKILEYYNVKPPAPNKHSMYSPVNPETISDELMSRIIFTYMQESIENYVRMFRTSITNESIRKLFIKHLTKIINDMDGIVQYLKIKGWLETPPIYQDIPKSSTETLSTAEAFHLWDHLIFRYDNLTQTMIYQEFAFDGDFKFLLKQGQELLQRNIVTLEKELIKFGIALPKQPPKFTVKPDNTELLDDEHMYRLLFMGMQGTLTVQAQALKQCTYNDSIRKIFKILLLDEIGFMNNLIKFGKLKGWLNSTPSYRET